MREENLIFLISQPRSGSTLLQKMLGAHSSVYTRSEPWIALNGIYNLVNDNLNQIVYDKDLERTALEDFVSGLSRGKNTYIDEIHNMLLNLYDNHLSQHKGAKFFLDKTPRYYFIISELLEIFPTSKMIILIRNPLAVLNSIIFRKKSLYLLSENKYDLTLSLEKLTEVLKNKNNNVNVIYYEELVKEPKKVLNKLCGYLNIKFEESMVTNFLNKNEKWTFGDQKIYNKTEVETASINIWQENLNNPQYWRFFYDYLLLIGKETFDLLGYNYNETLEIIQNSCPYQTIKESLDKTVALSVYLDNQRDPFIYNNLLSKQLNELRERIKKLKETVSEKDEVIKNKQEELAKKDQQISEKQNWIKKLKETVSEKDEVIKNNQEELAKKANIIEQKNNEVRKLKLDIQDITNKKKQESLKLDVTSNKLKGVISHIDHAKKNKFLTKLNPFVNFKHYNSIKEKIELIDKELGKEIVELPTDDYFKAKNKKIYINVNKDAPILIYQVGKVGSSTIYKSIKKHVKDVPIYQIHNITLADEILEDEKQKGFKDGLHHLEIGSNLKQIIHKNPEIKWRIITGVREPVQRWISDIFQNINERYSEFLNSKGEIKTKDLFKFIQNTIHSEPMQFWFDKELKQTFGIDIYKYSFNKNAGYSIIKEGNVDILVYQLEKLEKNFSKMCADFFNQQNFELLNDNVAKDKKYSKNYNEVINEIKFEESFLRNFYYESSICNHFYDQEDIERFILKWRC